MANKYKVTNLGKFDLAPTHNSGHEGSVEVTVDSFGKVVLNFGAFELNLDYDSVRSLDAVLNTVQRHIEDVTIDQAGEGIGQQKLDFMDDPTKW